MIISYQMCVNRRSAYNEPLEILAFYKIAFILAAPKVQAMQDRFLHKPIHSHTFLHSYAIPPIGPQERSKISGRSAAHKSFGPHDPAIGAWALIGEHMSPGTGRIAQHEQGP